MDTLYITIPAPTGTDPSDPEILRLVREATIGGFGTPVAARYTTTDPFPGLDDVVCLQYEADGIRPSGPPID